MKEINVRKERPLFFHQFQAKTATMMDATHVSVPKVLRGELLPAEATGTIKVTNVVREHLLLHEPLVTFTTTKMIFPHVFFQFFNGVEQSRAERAA